MNESGFARLTCASEHSRFSLRCDSVAWIDLNTGHNRRQPTLIALSAAGATTAVKAVRALLHQPNIKAALKVHLNEYRDTELVRAASYRTRMTGIGSGTCHLVASAVIPGLLTDNSDAALWAELTSNRFTTPLLKDWMDYLKARLEEERLLRESRGHNNRAVMLTADTDDLDAIVSQALKANALSLTASGVPHECLHA